MQLQPARLRDPELNDAVVSAQKFPALQHRLWREMQAGQNVTASYVREQVKLAQRSFRLSQAKSRQEQLILEWKRSHPALMASLEKQAQVVNSNPETKAVIEKEALAEQILQSAPLGLLLDPKHNLGQRRRSHRNQVSVEEQHRLLNDRIAGLVAKK